MRHVLDSGVFFHPSAIAKLAETGVPIVVPAVAFTERARHLESHGVRTSAFLAHLARNRIQIEPFSVEEAERYAVHVADAKRWKALARDAMIAGHVREDDILWTTNRRDFEALGVPSEQILDVK